MIVNYSLLRRWFDGKILPNGANIRWYKRGFWIVTHPEGYGKSQKKGSNTYKDWENEISMDKGDR